MKRHIVLFVHPMVNYLFMVSPHPPISQWPEVLMTIALMVARINFKTH